MRVPDFVEVPLPMLVVQRAEPEGVPTKGAKSGRTRRMPLADRVLPSVRALGWESASHRAAGSTTCGTRRPAYGSLAESTR